jgi:hypothetical protein
MQLFVSYSSRDKSTVKNLVRDLEATRHSVWVDEELTGGDSWWREILQRLRQSDVFVLALSNNSLRSKPCRAELEYATALGLPVVPVQIGPVESPRLAPVARIQIIDYRDATGAVGMALVSALEEGAAQRGELPDPLPEPPAIPYEYLMRLSARVDAPDLSAADQLSIVLQLRESLGVEDDEEVRADIGKLLRRLRSRTDVTFRVAGEIDALLRQQHADASPSGGTPPQHKATTPPPAGNRAPQPARQPGPSQPNVPTASRPQPPPRRPQPPPRRPAPQPTVRPPVSAANPTRPPPSRYPAPRPTVVRPNRAEPDRQLSILGMSLGAAGVLMPIGIGLVGVAGIICAGMAKSRKQPLADAALAVSIGCTGLGLLLLIIYIAAS